MQGAGTPGRTLPTQLHARRPRNSEPSMQPCMHAQASGGDRRPIQLKKKATSSRAATARIDLFVRLSPSRCERFGTAHVRTHARMGPCERVGLALCVRAACACGQAQQAAGCFVACRLCCLGISAALPRAQATGPGEDNSGS